MTPGETASSSISRNRLFIVLLACLAVRLVYVHFFGWRSIPAGSDGVSYEEYALAVLNRPDWLVNPTFPGHFRPPVYPLLIAFIYRLFGEGNLSAVFYAQAFIGTAAVYYLFKLSSTIFGEKQSALALLWGGVYYYYLWLGGMLLRETLISFFVLAMFYHLWMWIHEKREAGLLKSLHLWAFLTSFVLLIHTDARFLFYIPWIAVLFVGYLGFKVGVRRYAAALVLLLLLMTPWQIRNFIAYNGIVLVNTRTLDLRSSESSIRLNLLSTERITEVHENPHWKANLDYPSEEERAAVKQGRNPNSRPDYEVQMIRNDVRPATTFLGRKLFYTRDMWIPFRFSYSYSPFPEARIIKPWSTRHNAAAILFYGVLVPFAGIGVVRMFRHRQTAVWFLLFPILVHALLHFVTFGLERYRIQVDAFMIILGCNGMMEMGTLLFKRMRSASNNPVQWPAGGSV